MQKLSENKKIVISALAIFVISFSVMLFFLDSGKKLEGNADVLGHKEIQEEKGDFINRTINFLEIKSLYQTYINDFENSVFVIDSEGKFQYVSRDFCELLNINCTDILEKKFFDYVNSKDLTEFIGVHAKLLQEGEKIDGIGPFRMSNGDSEKLILFKAKPVLSKEKKATSIVFSAKDLTKKAEELNEKEIKGENAPSKNLYPNIEELKNKNPQAIIKDLVFLKD